MPESSAEDNLLREGGGWGLFECSYRHGCTRPGDRLGSYGILMKCFLAFPSTCYIYHCIYHCAMHLLLVIVLWIYLSKKYSVETPCNP